MKGTGLKLIFSCGFLGIGIFSGLFLYSLQWKCLDFVYSHQPFYGQFGKELAFEMHKRGYLLQCPDRLPRTSVYFLQTELADIKPKIDDHKHQLKIAFLGDCATQGYDIEYLRQFDVFLNVDKYQNGSLSFYNFRTTHFPLTHENETFCHTNYAAHQLDLPLLAGRLDNIIQGVRHEKF